MELTLAITGASGTIYAHRTLQLLAQSGAVEMINLIMSGTSATVAQVETGANLREPNAEKSMNGSAWRRILNQFVSGNWIIWRRNPRPAQTNRRECRSSADIGGGPKSSLSLLSELQ